MHDARVKMVTPELFRRFPRRPPCPRQRSRTRSSQPPPTGFFHNKAKSIQGAARKVGSEFSGESRQTLAELSPSLRRARKTARCFSESHSAKAEGVVVDTTSSASPAASAWPKATRPKKSEQELHAHPTEDRWIAFPHQLIHHGRQVCDARKPKCDRCNSTALPFHGQNVAVVARNAANFGPNKAKNASFAPLCRLVRRLRLHRMIDRQTFLLFDKPKTSFVACKSSFSSLHGAHYSGDQPGMSGGLASKAGSQPRSAAFGWNGPIETVGTRSDGTQPQRAPRPSARLRHAGRAGERRSVDSSRDCRAEAAPAPPPASVPVASTTWTSPGFPQCIRDHIPCNCCNEQAGLLPGCPKPSPSSSP